MDCIRRNLIKNHIITAYYCKETDNKIVEGQLIDLQEKQDLLLFKYARDEQLAVPLSLVFKVEQIVASDVQSMSDSHYVKIKDKSYDGLQHVKSFITFHYYLGGSHHKLLFKKKSSRLGINYKLTTIPIHR